MLIVYSRSSGAPASNSGTNSYLPDGPEFEAEVRNAINVLGGTAEDYGEYRLHDEDDADLVQAILHAGSYELECDGDTPTGVRVYPRLAVAASPNPAPEEDVTITATVTEAHGVAETGITFSVEGVPGSEQTVAPENGEASAVYAFADPGRYRIVAESQTKYGRAVMGVTVE